MDLFAMMKLRLAGNVELKAEEVAALLGPARPGPLSPLDGWALPPLTPERLRAARVELQAKGVLTSAEAATPAEIYALAFRAAARPSVALDVSVLPAAGGPGSHTRFACDGSSVAEAFVLSDRLHLSPAVSVDRLVDVLLQRLGPGPANPASDVLAAPRFEPCLQLAKVLPAGGARPQEALAKALAESARVSPDLAAAAIQDLRDATVLVEDGGGLRVGDHWAAMWTALGTPDTCLLRFRYAELRMELALVGPPGGRMLVEAAPGQPGLLGMAWPGPAGLRDRLRRHLHPHA